MTIRIGFVGCGHIASVHSLAIGALGDAGIVDARVVAAYDSDRGRAARLAAPHDAVVADEIESLVDACDVVWVCTWTSEHLPVVRAAVARGRSVFCEKPLAPTLAECEEVAALLRQVPHQVGLVLRNAPVFRALAGEVQSGRFGRPLATVFRDDQYFPNQGMYRSEWRADASLAGGGTLIEHSIHDVDLLRWVLGDPSEVSARLANRFGHAGIDDVAAVTFAYPDASVATLTSIWHQVMRRPSTRRIEVFCEDAMLWTDDDCLGPLHVETTDAVSQIDASFPAWIGDLQLAPEIAALLAPYVVAARAFLDALATGASGEPDAATALAAHQLVDAAYRSASEGGAPLPVPAR